MNCNTFQPGRFSYTIREIQGLEVEIEGISLTNIKISKDFTKNIATQAMISLLKVDKFSGPSMQCHISYHWSYTWTALLWDIHKSSSTLYMDGEPPLQHFCQVTAILMFPAAWFCLFDCSGHKRLAVLSCIPFNLLGKRLTLLASVSMDWQVS